MTVAGVGWHPHIHALLFPPNGELSTLKPKRRRMMRPALSSLPWLGVRAHGFGHGWVLPR